MIHVTVKTRLKKMTKVKHETRRLGLEVDKYRVDKYRVVELLVVML